VSPRRYLVAGVAAACCLVIVPRASATEQIYWTNLFSDTISHANADGTGDGGELDTTGIPAQEPEGIAMDPDTGRILWANSGADSISWAAMDGSGGGQLNTGAATVNVPIGLTVDTATDRVYWINAGTDTIAYADADGSGQGGELNTTGASVDDPDGLTIDPAGGRLYWTDYDPSSIDYADLDGSGGGTFNTSPLTADKPFGIVANPGDGRVYWSDLGTGGLLYARTDIAGLGGTLLHALLNPFGIAIDPVAGQVFWIDGHGINSAGLDGSNPTVIPTTGATQAVPQYMAVVAAPIAAGAPTITAGAQLSCSRGTWAPDAPGDFFYRSPFDYTYRWTLGGTTIPGQTAATLSPATAGTYACAVTGSNSAGSATTQTSAPVFAAPPVGTGQPTPSPAAPTGRTTPGTPSLTGVAEAHRVWREHPGRGRHVPVGTTFSFTVNQGGRVALVFWQTVEGRLVHGACRTGAHAGHRGRRCWHVFRNGSLSVTVAAGRHRVRFDGRVDGRRLGPGSYGVSLTATSTATGRHSSRRFLRFRIVG
jgi:DNA-binding beta-propeller fold protein YncE